MCLTVGLHVSVTIAGSHCARQRKAASWGFPPHSPTPFASRAAHVPRQNVSARQPFVAYGPPLRAALETGCSRRSEGRGRRNDIYMHAAPAHSDDRGTSAADLATDITGQVAGPLQDISNVLQISEEHPNRTLLVSFRCSKCGGTSQRLVNPRAWQRGTVFLQCQCCQVWHNVKDNLKLVEEIRFTDDQQVDGGCETGHNVHVQIVRRQAAIQAPNHIIGIERADGT